MDLLVKKLLMLHVTFALLLTSSIYIEPMSAKLFDAPLPILSEYEVSDAPTPPKADGFKDYIRVLLRLSSSEELPLPEDSRVLRRYSIIPYVAAEVPINRLNEVKKLGAHVDRVFSLQMLKQGDRA